jgi:hypothetical protein
LRGIRSVETKLIHGRTYANYTAGAEVNEYPRDRNVTLSTHYKIEGSDRSTIYVRLFISVYHPLVATHHITAQYYTSYPRNKAVLLWEQTPRCTIIQFTSSVIFPSSARLRATANSLEQARDIIFSVLQLPESKNKVFEIMCICDGEEVCLPSLNDNGGAFGRAWASNCEVIDRGNEALHLVPEA